MTTLPYTFEEIYKSAYSHGLEAIYTLENIDIKSIRRIEIPLKSTSKSSNNKKITSHALQEEFDFGEEFRCWIPPFIKKEPIQVLEISRHAEKCLLENGKKNLGDLIGEPLNDFVFLRSIGQSHIEEIQQKLKSYLEGQLLEKGKHVNFFSWLKTLVGAQERKKVFVLLEKYDLSDLFQLTPSENVEIRKLTREKKQEWIEELLQKIADTKNKQTVADDLKRIFNAFFKPWIRQRMGFATKNEIHERLQQISTNPSVCLNFLRFLQETYFDQEPIFHNFLYEMDRQIYTCDHMHLMNYEKIVNQALTYFYQPTIHYHIKELVGMMERDYSKQWLGFPEGYIEKILRVSPSFHTLKNATGHLSIYCNRHFHHTFS